MNKISFCTKNRAAGEGRRDIFRRQEMRETDAIIIYYVHLRRRTDDLGNAESRSVDDDVDTVVKKYRLSLPFLALTSVCDDERATTQPVAQKVVCACCIGGGGKTAWKKPSGGELKKGGCISV